MACDVHMAPSRLYASIFAFWTHGMAIFMHKSCWMPVHARCMVLRRGLSCPPSHLVVNPWRVLVLAGKVLLHARSFHAVHKGLPVHLAEGVLGPLDILNAL